MINFDDVTKENIKEHNSNRLQTPHHPYRILIIGGSGSGKINSLFNLISHQLDKIYLYAKDLCEVKYQLLFKKPISTVLKHLNDSKAFIECSNDIDDVYKSIEEYNPNKKQKMLISFCDIVADMLSNKKPNQ